MEDEELEELFGYINAVEDRLQQIDDNMLDNMLYDYIIQRFYDNEYCSIEDYKEYIKE